MHSLLLTPFAIIKLSLEETDEMTLMEVWNYRKIGDGDFDTMSITNYPKSFNHR
jgi:hypothetical protein